MLEREDHAVARGARVYCQLAGSGSSGDAEHVTSGREDGAGAVQVLLGVTKLDKYD